MHRQRLKKCVQKLKSPQNFRLCHKFAHTISYPCVPYAWDDWFSLCLSLNTHDFLLSHIFAFSFGAFVCYSHMHKERSQQQQAKIYTQLVDEHKNNIGNMHSYTCTQTLMCTHTIHNFISPLHTTHKKRQTHIKTAQIKHIKLSFSSRIFYVFI